MARGTGGSNRGSMFGMVIVLGSLSGCAEGSRPTATDAQNTSDATTTSSTATSEETTAPTPTTGEPTTVTGGEASTTAAGECGNGSVEPGEECDDGGESANCDVDCTVATCSDKVINGAAGEECDDGGESPTCNSDCTAAACGDSVLNPSAGESCDDGNAVAGDSCSVDCRATNIVDMALGAAHTCVAFESGEVRCWGDSAAGQIGYGNIEDLGDEPGELPAPAVPVGGESVAVGAGSSHSCVRLVTDTARCWGRGDKGQLGYGNAFNLGDSRGELPTADIEVGAAVLQIVGGDAHSCALVSGGAVRCWGSAEFGGLGYGNLEDRSTPGPDVPGVDQATQLAVGFRHACVLQQGGVVRCWGYNGDGQLGLGNTNSLGDAPNEMPLPADVGGEVAQIAVANHSCAVMKAGTVRCWGHNAFGKLGYGSTVNLGDEIGEMPRPDLELGGPATQVVTGYSHTCALMANKKVKCWGDGQWGALGYASTDSLGDGPGEMPPPDVDLGGDAVKLWSHLGHSTCALLADGTLRCWGLNDSGQLGYGHFDNVGDDETPASAGPVPF